MKITESEKLAYFEIARLALSDADFAQDAGEIMDLSTEEMDRLHKKLIDYMSDRISTVVYGPGK